MLCLEEQIEIKGIKRMDRTGGRTKEESQSKYNEKQETSMNEYGIKSKSLQLAVCEPKFSRPVFSCKT